MAKMTLSGLASLVSSYVAAAKQAGTYSASYDTITKLLDKIGAQVTIDGDFQDKLPELDGFELPLGKTIEEYFVDLVLPTAWANVGDQDTPNNPSFETAAYSTTLGRVFVKTTMPYDVIERGCISPVEVGNIAGKIMERLENSTSLTRYNEKKQLLGNAIDKAVTASCYAKVDKPVDTSTGENFIKKIKEYVEAAQFAHEGDCLGGSTALIGASPELVLYIKKGVIPSVEVDTLAGAFNEARLAVPCKIKVVDDFGTMTNSKSVYALLCDPRGIKLHRGYNAVRSHENAEKDFMNYYHHWEDTAFISKFSYIKAIGENA